MGFILSRKKVLITNDDGIEGEGLRVLYEAMSEKCDVYVLVPDSNRSAVSSLLTLYRPLKYVKIREKFYTCSGSPVDCVISALKSSLFEIKFDCVLSGINKGPNMGTDIIYSGTAAAARQAVLYGVPGIALSLASDGEDCNVGNFDYRAMAEFCRDNLDSLISLWDGKTFVSLNAVSSDSYSGAMPATLCVREYGDSVEIKDEGGGTFSGSFRGGNILSHGDENCDFQVTKKNKISVTLIYAEPVCKEIGSFDLDS